MENQKMMNNEFFEKALDNFQDADAIKRPSVSYWKDVWRRLLKNKLSVVGMIILSTLVIVAIYGAFFTDTPYHLQDYTNTYAPPQKGLPFGTDDAGRDEFVRLSVGTLISLSIGVAATFVNLVMGILVGGIAGLKGGKIDTFLMRVCEILYAIPFMLIAILLMVVFGGSILTMIIALTVTSWVPMARLIRGQVLQIKQLEFVHASQAFGGSTRWVLLKHLIPNAMGPIIVNVTLHVPAVIFSEATLSYLGLGIPAPLPSLGTMSNDALTALLIGKGELLLYPALAICLIMFSFNVIGDGLRDALDPKLRK